MTETTTDLRCSSWTRSQGVDPVGTAGSYAGFLLVEWPLPWPRDISEIPQLQEVARAAKAANVRLQGVVPQGDLALTVGLYLWNPSAARFEGVEAPAGSSPAKTALALLSGDRPPGTHPIEVVDVLVCGHGRRDRCCGSLGTSLEIELRAGGPMEASREVRLRRTSHTGGHRFAPTAIVFPEGSSWAFLEADLLRSIVNRTADIDSVLAKYRGCSGWPSPAIQAVERGVLGSIGWDLFDAPRRASDDGNGNVTFSVDHAGGSRTWKAKVVAGRTLPVPTCGEALTGNEKTETEMLVEDFAEQSN